MEESNSLSSFGLLFQAEQVHSLSLGSVCPTHETVGLSGSFFTGWHLKSFYSETLYLKQAYGKPRRFRKSFILYHNIPKKPTWDVTTLHSGHTLEFLIFQQVYTIKSLFGDFYFREQSIY